MKTDVKGFVGSFRKSNGELRRMRFVRIADLPENRIPTRKTDKPPRNLCEGTELVWDLDQQGYRTFNFGTLEDELARIEVDDLELPQVLA